MVVNTWDRISVERWIFTAAHELGHLLLHPSEYRRDATELPTQAEREADAFASEFLMTERAFDAEWDATRGHSLLLRVLKIKRIFRVSYKTVLHRLVESGRETSRCLACFPGPASPVFRQDASGYGRAGGSLERASSRGNGTVLENPRASPGTTSSRTACRGSCGGALRRERNLIRGALPRFWGSRGTR